jgi:hypothetical protein
MTRDCVYIIGAGFSAGLGYPLTSDLLQRLWQRLKDRDFKSRLTNVIEFHHHGFDPKRFSSFPNVEQLLSQMEVNYQFFDASRNHTGEFTKEKLQDIQQRLLLELADWFHALTQTIQMKRAQTSWLRKFKDRVERECAAVISFNWDLVLDELLFGDNLNANSYGFPQIRDDAPVLLKPHGSLNWFEDKAGKFIKEAKRFAVHKDGDHTVYAFRDLTRGPDTKHSRTYRPLIIPPVFLKKFDDPIFTKLWQRATSELSNAKKVVFLGYSMPDADLHAVHCPLRLSQPGQGRGLRKRFARRRGRPRGGDHRQSRSRRGTTHRLRRQRQIQMRLDFRSGGRLGDGYLGESQTGVGPS